MNWKEVCKAWDAGSTQAFTAVYGDGALCVRPLGEDSFEYRVRGHRTQHDREWRGRDRWFDLAAANGDIAHLVFQESHSPGIPGESFFSGELGRLLAEANV